MASSSTGKGKGRQKIKMEKMEKKSNLQVTFSKRRVGVFKQAHELSILTGAEVAVIVFSPGGKVYSFGHPTTEAVAERFLTGISRPLSLTEQLVQAQHDANVIGINAKLGNIKEMIEFEKKRGEALDKFLAENQNHWGTINVDEQNLSQLQQSVVALKNVKANLEREINAKAFAQQNYIAPHGGYSYSGREEGYQPFQLVGSTYEGIGTGSSLSAVSPPIVYAGNVGSDGGGGGNFFHFLMGTSGYEVGGSGGVLPGSTSLEFYDNVGGLSLSSERSLFGVGGGCGSEPYIVGPSSSLGLSNIYNANSSGVGNVGVGVGEGNFPFLMGPSDYAVGGNDGVLPGSASLEFYGNVGGLSLSSKHSLFGVGGGGGSGPYTVGPSSSPGLSNIYEASSSRVGSVGVGGDNSFPFLMGPSGYEVGGSGGVLPGSASLEFYDNVGGLSLSSDLSLFGIGGRGGSGPYIVGPSSSPGLPNIYEGSSSGVGNVGVGGGNFFPFLMGPSGYEVGGNGGVLSGSASLEFYGNVDGLSLSSEHSLFGIGGGGGSGPYIVGPSSSPGLQNIYEASSSGVGNVGDGWALSDGPSPFSGGSFISRPSSFVGYDIDDDLPNIEGASTSGVGNDDGGSNARVLDWNGSLPLNGFGDGF